MVYRKVYHHVYERFRESLILLVNNRKNDDDHKKVTKDI